MPSHPMAKQVLNKNRKTVSAIPLLVDPTESVAARTIIQIDIPAAPNNISFRRPILSIVNTAIHDAAKYSVPLHAAMSLALNAVRPTSFCNTFGISALLSVLKTCIGQTRRRIKPRHGFITQATMTWQTRYRFRRRLTVGDEIDTRDLLEHLVDIGQNDAMKVAILVHGEQVAEAAL